MTTYSAATRAEIGPELVNGDWISVSRRSYGVARVRTQSTDDALAVRAYGGGEPRPGDWGEVAADGVYVLRAGAGYAIRATFDGPVTSSHLQTNQAHGVMAVHAFHRFTDGTGRRDYFTREFYVPTAAEDPPGEADDGLPLALLTGANDPSVLAGNWRVLDQANMNISALDCAVADGELGVHAYGNGIDGPADWGTTNARLYADTTNPGGPPAFLATFALDDRKVHVQARDYLGILVAAQYTEFTDGSGRADYFTRDCFRR